MADEQQEHGGELPAEQGKPVDDTSPPKDQEPSVGSDGNPAPVEEAEDSSSGPKGTSPAADGGTNVSQEPALDTGESSSQKDVSEDSDPSSPGNLEDQPDVNNDASDEDQIQESSQENQESKDDANDASKSQSAEADQSAQDTDLSRTDPAEATGEDSKSDPQTPDGDSALAQAQDAPASQPELTDGPSSEQKDRGDAEPSGEPVQDEMPEGGEGDGRSEKEEKPAEADSVELHPEPDQEGALGDPPSKGVHGEVDATSPTVEAVQQSQASDEERAVPQEDAVPQLPAAASQEVTADETEGAGDVPDPTSPAHQEPSNPEEASAEIEAPESASPSPPPSDPRESASDEDPDGVVADAVEEPREASPDAGPSAVQDRSPAADTTPSPLQDNNNNSSSSSEERHVGGSVRIPTAHNGEQEEPLSSQGSPGDLREPALFQARPPHPMDARGDANVRILPAISRSLPAILDPPDNHRTSHQQRGMVSDRGRSTHIPRIPSASGSTRADMREGDVRRALNSAKLPPSVMKMSTVMVSARKRAVLNRNASVFYEEKQHSKVITLDQAINSRPPMPFDLEGPGPCSYSPRNKPLNEDNSPEYTFGQRLYEKSGGGRTAYAKSWYNSNSGFTQKVHYEKRWPSPAHYNSTRPLLGHRKPTMVDYPSFTIGVKSKFSISKRGAEDEPGPNEYNRSTADAATLRKAPSFSISHRHQGTKLWSGNEATPGPGTYNPRWGHSSGLIHRPSFTIKGVRRFKSHQLGPHSTF